MRISDWSSDVCSSDLDPPREDDLVVILRFSTVPDAVRRAAGERHRDRTDRQCLRHDVPLRGHRRRQADRKSVVKGKSVSVRVDLGGRRIIKKKTSHKKILVLTV